MNALIAIAFAVALSTQMLLKNAQHEAARIHELVGTAVGQQLDRLTQAVNSYSSKNLSVITSGAGQIVDANGNAVVVVNKYAPTVAELNAMGFLTGNFNAVNYFGGGYVVALNNSPVGCAYPNCMLDGMVYLTAPVLSKGLPDITVLGAAVQKIGGNGGFSKLASPGTISGFSGGWNKPNPAGNVAGILAEQAGTYSYDSLYYRLDGSKGLTATFNAGNQALSNIKQVSSGSVCVGNTFALSDGTNGVTVNMPLTCVGGAYTPPTSGGKMPAANFAALPTTGNSDGDIRGTLDLHRAYMWYASLSSWVPLTVDQNGNFSVPGTLTAQSVAASGRVSANTLRPTLVAVADTSCAGYQQGDLAQNAAGLTLSCQSGMWAKAQGGGGTGMTGLLAPLKGKTISCFFTQNTFGKILTGTAYAMVDATGSPFARATFDYPGAWFKDTGWVSGFNATITGYIQSGWNAGGYPSLFASDPGNTVSCVANWPYT